MMMMIMMMMMMIMMMIMMMTAMAMRMCFLKASINAFTERYIIDDACQADWA